MGGKIRCPSCGAKNDAKAHRCRVCTTIIQAKVEEPEAPAASSGPNLDDHFDANALTSSMGSAKERVAGKKSGGLGARIAAAGTAGTSDRYAGLQPSQPAGDGAGGGAYSGGGTVADGDLFPRPMPSTPPPIAPADDEPFVPMSFETSSFGGSHGPSPAPTAPASEETFDPDALFGSMGPTAAPRPSAPPPPADDDVFDPDALFRDMGN